MDDQRVDRESGGVKYRKLRIAFSAVCGIVCLLLIVLWVRSYVWIEVMTLPAIWGTTIEIGSFKGAFAVGAEQDGVQWEVERYSAKEWEQFVTSVGPVAPLPSTVWGGIYKTPAATTIFLPYWLLAIAFAACAASPWRQQLSFRFSLRTLLIAMTLVAVVLGLMVWAARK
jgi:hypothetical protein